MRSAVQADMTVTDFFGIFYWTGRRLKTKYLADHYGQMDLMEPRIMAVDKISLRNGQCYLRCSVIDYETGQIVHVSKGRKARTLKRFLNKLTGKQRKSIEALVMEM